MTAIPTFKCLLVGNGGVGKSSLVMKHLTGEFDLTYTPTIGADVQPLVFNTTIGPIKFNIWDNAGIDKFDGFATWKEMIYTQAACAIIMFSLTDRESYNAVPKCYNDIVKVCGKIPMILVGNKVDLKARIVTPTMIDYHREFGLWYCDTSSKSNYHFDRPFVALSKMLLNDPTITLID